ncbi:hypothetical protein [Kutzneria buriramensis]|uniref:Uncharacterized protein n=1 Tax=Kutzneria buriramensis TaxID=1045776 RepID=A0A3E0I5P7_9PSEU|nr:hypothetical protein [Kutzneria buriramensis]REH53921.1 hypothetical protein BCF44_102142 [Kutzneria buriramensis]
MIRRLLVVLAVLGLSIGTAAPAMAYEPVDIVHTERVQVGPYGVTVGFSTWPVRAMQSLDFTFIPDGGIEDKSGTLVRTLPSGAHYHPAPLARHPRKRDVWGLDVFALQTEGDWKFTFAIDGPQGHGEGTAPVSVLSQPGPPLALSWVVCAIPFFALVAFLVIAWRRGRKVSAVAVA